MQQGSPHTSPDMTGVPQAAAHSQLLPCCCWYHVHPRQEQGGRPVRGQGHQEKETHLTFVEDGRLGQGKSMNQEHTLHQSERKQARLIIIENNCYSNRICANAK